LRLREFYFKIHYSILPILQHFKFSSVLGDKSANRTIVRAFPLGGEETAWELFIFPMIGNTFTTFSLVVTGLISAGASGFVFF